MYFSKNKRLAAAMLFVVGSALSLVAPRAEAAFIPWTLTNVTFIDNDNTTGLLSGSFEYDAASNTYQNISITNTTTSRFNSSYPFGSPITLFPGVPNATRLLVMDGAPHAGAHELLLTFVSALTSSGGTVALQTGLSNSFLAACLTNNCSVPNVVVALGRITGGSVTAVPLPAAGWLLLSGLGGLGALARRRRESLAA
jgi:hypothetical protein